MLGTETIVSSTSTGGQNTTNELTQVDFDNCRAELNQCHATNSELTEQLAAGRVELRQWNFDCTNVRMQLQSCERDLEFYSAENRWPPVFDLTEARGFSFESGKSNLTPSFRRLLDNAIIPQIESLLGNDRFGITTIEIIGHTDEVPVGNRQSNLDLYLTRHLGLERGLPALSHADNAGLGLSRAVAVRSYLLRNRTLRNYRIVVLSAAQGVDDNGEVAIGSIVRFAASERRRIEIRLRGDAETIQ